MRLIAIDRFGKPMAATPELPAPALAACRSRAVEYGSAGYLPPWTGYVAVSGPACVGTCGFKAPPKAGCVEIACFTFPDYEGHGFGTQMARALVELAWRVDPGLTVVAQSVAIESAYTTILRKLGFLQYDTAQCANDGAVWEWRLQAYGRGVERERVAAVI